MVLWAFLRVNVDLLAYILGVNIGCEMESIKLQDILQEQDLGVTYLAIQYSILLFAKPFAGTPN